MRPEYLQAVREFEGKKILVIGDIGIDEYVYGTSDRLSPEAPVPVFEEFQRSSFPGLAANVAANIKSLGGVPILFGVTGEDEDRLKMEEILSERQIDCSHLTSHNMRHTTKKTRFVINRQTVLRVDQETRSQFMEGYCKSLLRKISSIEEGFNIVVLSDYGKGMFLYPGMIRHIKNLFKDKVVVCDPKPSGKNALEYCQVDYLTPNLKEATLLAEELNCGGSIELFKSMAVRSLVIKMGHEGICVANDEGIHQIPAIEKKVYDVSGAGDTVVATLSLSLACGLKDVDAARLANVAGSFVVSQPGTSSINNEDLYAELCGT